MRRGLEDSLLYFCSVGSEKISATNRKSKRSKTITDSIPKYIPGVDRRMDYLVQETEGKGDFSPFTDLFDGIEEEQTEEEKLEEDVPMEEDETEQDQVKAEDDDPMGTDDQPEAKRRKIVSMIQSINSTAEKETICLACGNADHSIVDCPNQDAKEEVKSAFNVILARIQQQQPRPKTKKTEQPKRKRVEEEKETAEKMTVLYPAEVSMLERCAELQGGQWAVMGTKTNDLGPMSHAKVVDDIIRRIGK